MRSVIESVTVNRMKETESTPSTLERLLVVGTLYLCAGILALQLIIRPLVDLLF